MNKIEKIVLTTSISLLLSSTAWADADIALQSGGAATQATAHVDLEVIVPEILIFGVGPTGDTISELSWALSPAAALGGTANTNDVTYSGAVGAVGGAAIATPSSTALTITNGGPSSSVAADVGTLRVFLFSNHGTDVTITAQTTAGVGGGGTVGTLSDGTGDTIPIADFTTGIGTAGVTNPGLSGTGDTAVAAATGIVNVVGTWTYQFTGAIPSAGTHSGRVTYVAAQP